MKLLLVEDDVTLCNLLATMLKFEGLTSITAHDGYEAEKILMSEDAGTIDLILCDVMMPNMDGYGLLERVKNISTCQNIPFIFISAHVSREEEARGLAAGARAYLKKPVDIAKLLAIIADIKGD